MTETGTIPASMWTCAGCSALNPNRDRECGACGEPRDAELSRRRLTVGRELTNVRRDLRAIRLIFAVGAVADALLLWVDVASGEAETPVVAFTGGFIALWVVAAVRVFREPFLWCALLASLRTLVLLLLVAVTGAAGWVYGYAGLLTAGLWFVAFRAKRAASLVAEHPDLWDALRHHRRRDEMEEGQLTARAKGRGRRRADRGSLVRVGLAAGGAVVLAVAAWFLWLRPPSVAPALRAFEEAWAASSVEGVTAGFAESSRVSMGRSFERLVERRGWTDDFPTLGARTDDFRDDAGRTTWTCGDGTLVVHWSLRGDRWVVRGLAPGDG